MREPGAWVEGHRGAVRAQGRSSRAECGCGHTSVAMASVQGACLALVLHLQAAVRDGAVVRRGDGDGDDGGGGGGLAGVREPRRPAPSRGSGGVELGDG